MERRRRWPDWAAIIAVPTVVTGYFGQNVPYPGFQQECGFFLSVARSVESEVRANLATSA